MSVLHLKKQIEASNSPKTLSQITHLPDCLLLGSGPLTIRTWQGMTDSDRFLRLYHRATSQLVPQPRPWSMADLRSQIINTEGFDGCRMWLVDDCSTQEPSCVGSVTLLHKRGPGVLRSSVHWLLVDPDYRRRGIATALLQTVEEAFAALGGGELHVETHRFWEDAVSFYLHMGFVPARGGASSA